MANGIGYAYTIPNADRKSGFCPLWKKIRLEELNSLSHDSGNQLGAQDTPRQVDLFMNIEKIEKAERLDRCIETIRQRFGKNSIRNGILFQNLWMPSEKPEITMPTGVLC